MSVSDHFHLISGRRLQWLIWISLLSGLAYLCVSLWGGWRDVVRAFDLVGLTGAAIALLLSLINYGLRFVRWQYYLRLLGHNISFTENLRIYIAGFALTIVPGKAGEAIRSVFLKRHGMGYRPSLAAFFTERFSDLIAILALAAIGIWQYREAQPVVLAMSVFLLIVLLLLYQRRLIDRLHGTARIKLPQRLAPTIDAFADILGHSRQCLRPLAMLLGIVLGVVSWGSEGVAFHFILQWMDADLDWRIAIFIYAFSMLIGAISFLPGGLGGAEATMIGFLLLNGVSAPNAVAATVITRLATLWFAVLLGMIALAFLKRQDSLTR
jgi:uncharacterized protein (TIRG00374 family)